jgi:hypothetical protein
MKVIEMAKAEIGYKDNSGISKYFTELFPKEKAKPYCVPFIEWVFTQAYGEAKAKEKLHIDEYIQSPVALMNYFKQGGYWHRNKFALGYLLFLRTTNEAINHVELVTDYSDSTITGIGGNIDGEVKEVIHDINDRRIAGFGKIEYKEETE